MAVAPLFNKNLDVLYKRLRLSKPVTTDTSNEYINRAIQHVRVLLSSELGSDVAIILATTPVDNPTTDAELKRLTAEILEAIWIEYMLICTMPVMLFDSALAAPPSQLFNQEPLTREIDPDTLELKKNELLRWKDDLLGDLTDTSVLNVVCIGRDPNSAVPAILGTSTIYQAPLIARWYPPGVLASACGEGCALNINNECECTCDG